jgi:hypothetical protein
MHKSAMRAGVLPVTVMLLVATAAAARPCAVTYHAPGDFEGQIDQDGARAAVKRGDAAPFQKILRQVRPLIHGEIVGQKLEQHRGVWVYEFRYIDANGHMQLIHFGARSGRYAEVRPLPCASS